MTPKTAEEGARIIFHVATADLGSDVSGSYWANDHVFSTKTGKVVPNWYLKLPKFLPEELDD